MKNRSLPVDTLLPHLAYDDVAEAIGWLTRVFGFVEQFRYGSPVAGAQIGAGPGLLMLQASRPAFQTPQSLGAQTQTLTIFSSDVETLYSRVQQQGAEIVEPLNQTVYGELQFAALDLAGHRFIFSQHLQDLAPSDWGAVPPSESLS